MHVSTAVHKGQATLVVADAGEGIDPEDEEHVFERFYFYRVRSTAHSASEPVPGSGLGLAIVAAIMASVSSGPGTGAMFEVAMPPFGLEFPACAAAPKVRAGVASENSRSGFTSPQVNHRKHTAR